MPHPKWPFGQRDSVDKVLGQGLGEAERKRSVSQPDPLQQDGEYSGMKGTVENCSSTESLHLDACLAKRTKSVHC